MEAAAKLRETCFGGGSMKDHESKPIKLDSLKNSSSCRYRNVRPHSLPAESRSFVGMARETAAMPPAFVKSGSDWKPLETGCDTHTQTACTFKQGRSS